MGWVNVGGETDTGSTGYTQEDQTGLVGPGG